MESFKEASRKDGIKCISKRQEKKDKQKAIKGKFFLVNWLDEEDDVFDVVPSKSVVPPENKNILDITAGTICRVAYSGEFYRAKIIECGNITIVSGLQKAMERQCRERDRNPKSNHNEAGK